MPLFPRARGEGRRKRSGFRATRLPSRFPARLRGFSRSSPFSRAVFSPAGMRSARFAASEGRPRSALDFAASDPFPFRGDSRFLSGAARLSDTRRVVPQRPPTDFIVFPPSHSSRLVSASRPLLPLTRSLIIIRLLAGPSLCSSAAHRLLLRTQSAFLRARARVIRVWVINYTGVNWLLRDDHRKQPITSSSPRLFPRLPSSPSPPSATARPVGEGRRKIVRETNYPVGSAGLVFAKLRSLRPRSGCK